MGNTLPPFEQNEQPNLDTAKLVTAFLSLAKQSEWRYHDDAESYDTVGEFSYNCSLSGDSDTGEVTGFENLTFGSKKNRAARIYLTFEDSELQQIELQRYDTSGKITDLQQITEFNSEVQSAIDNIAEVVQAFEQCKKHEPLLDRIEQVRRECTSISQLVGSPGAVSSSLQGAVTLLDEAGNHHIEALEPALRTAIIQLRAFFGELKE
ncbi:hypothetical protein KKC44_01775 [Patescibacteria group bacterium]|nr:hypothetical protein [Patescibacteria group bacterium]MBU2259311.1 hypothetical protein [Patescibacteria group bacterium]